MIVGAKLYNSVNGYALIDRVIRACRDQRDGGVSLLPLGAVPRE
jgi:hypothetical protein